MLCRLMFKEKSCILQGNSCFTYVCLLVIYPNYAHVTFQYKLLLEEATFGLVLDQSQIKDTMKKKTTKDKNRHICMYSILQVPLIYA